MKLVVLHKYINCTLDKVTGTATGHTTYICYITTYVTVHFEKNSDTIY